MQNSPRMKSDFFRFPDNNSPESTPPNEPSFFDEALSGGVEIRKSRLPDLGAALRVASVSGWLLLQSEQQAVSSFSRNQQSNPQCWLRIRLRKQLIAYNTRLL